jgi:prevent-host-death family protein
MNEVVTMVDHERLGVRELKAKLSSYLERVKAGETIMVTDRGVPVAEIRPVGAARVLDELIAAGLASRGTQSGWLPEPIPIQGTVMDLLDEERR